MQNLPPLTPSQLAEFDTATGYETPVRPDLAPVRRVIGSALMTALAVGVGAPLLSATPAYAADTLYSKSSEDATRTMSVEAMPNGARADFEGVDCAALDAIVKREASVRGLDSDVSCADGFGSVSLYGDVTAAQSALAETASDALDQPSQALTAAEVAVEQAAVDAIKPRLIIQMPNNIKTTRSTHCAPARGNAVMCVTNFDQQLKTGQDFAVPKVSLAYLVEHTDNINPATGGYATGVKLSVLSPQSDIIDPSYDPPQASLPAGFYQLTVCLENGQGVNNPCVDNMPAGKKTVEAIAQNGWSTSLRIPHASKHSRGDRLTFDNLIKYVRDAMVCNDLSSWSTTCYDTFTAITREQATDTFLGRTTGFGTDFGMILVRDTSTYDGTGMLVNSPTEFLMSDPRWTFQFPSREGRIYSHMPGVPLIGWSFDFMTTLFQQQEGTNTFGSVQYTGILPNPTHRQP